MKKVLFVLIALVAAMGIAQTPPSAPLAPVGALCDLGNNAAASLLVPYFEVDSADTNGLDTLVGIINVDVNPIVAHVVVWNVDSWGVFDFNIYMTGYDVVTFSMRQILVYGNMPNNGCATSSSRFTTRYIDCNGDGDYFGQGFSGDGLFSVTGYNMDIACYTTMSAATLADWQCKLSIGSYDGWNANYVGYLTIDNTVTCNGGMPDGGLRYFQTNYIDTNDDAAADHGILENSNVMLGDIFYYDNAGSQSDGVPAVHIEAFGEANALALHTWGMTPAAFAGLGINTFYYKYESGVFPPNDARENLPLWWGFRYIGNSAFDGGTSVDVWRSHSLAYSAYYVPDGPCIWAGLGAAYSVLIDDFGATQVLGLPRPALIIFDEEENTTQSGGGPSPPPPIGGFDLLFLEAQRVEVATPDWPLVEESGWIGIAFDTDAQNLPPNGPGPGFGSSFDQSWVNVRYRALDRYTLGLSAVSYLNGCSLVWNGAAFAPVATH